MRCPQCGHEHLHPPAPCPDCGFTGDAARLEELAHVAYLLAELDSWGGLPRGMVERLRARYTQRRDELEVALGLRPRPLAPDEVRPAWQEVRCLDVLLARLPAWTEKGWVRPEAAQALIARSQKRRQDLHARLTATPRALALEPAPDALAQLRYLRRTLDDLHGRGDLTDEAAYAAALAEIAAVEDKLGQRPRPAPKPAAAPPLPRPPAPRPKPREPITWDRILQTVLSERTLKAMLFLGVFLLFVAGLIVVVFNWDRFPPLAQLLFLAAFTFSFFALGWFVRIKVRLRNSGLALTAIGSLLIPLDFYAIYLSGHLQAYVTPAQFWLIASAFCLLVYTATTYAVEAEFFGYLTAAAAGSLLCAAMYVLGLSPDWYAGALCLLALLVVPLAQRTKGAGRWQVFHRPLWLATLLAVTVILPLSLGLYAVGQVKGDEFRVSMAIAWWLGGAVYALGAWRFRSRALGVGAALALPAAVYLTQAPLFDRWQTPMAWHALGWAILTPLYLVAGRGLQSRTSNHARTPLVVGLAMAMVAAPWSFISFTRALDAATATYAVLTSAAILAAVLWKRPAWLLAASFCALVSTTAGMWARELAFAHLSLGWALLAVVHLALAVSLRKRPACAAPVYLAGFVVAVLSLLPPLVTLNRAVLIYVLGNWIVLAAWTAWLTQTGRHPGLNALLRSHAICIPHWAAAVPIPAWLWLVWMHDWPYRRFDPAWLGVGYALLAWGLVFLGRRLQIANPKDPKPKLGLWALGFGPCLPWYVVGYLTSTLAPLAALHYFAGERLLVASTFALISALYFVSAWRFRQRWWLVPAGLTLPVAWLLILAEREMPVAVTGTLLALAPTAYLLAGLLLVRKRRVERDFLLPLNCVAHGLAALALAWSLAPLGTSLLRHGEWADPDRLWAAGGQLLLAGVYGLVAWDFRRERWGHVAAWLSVAAGGIVATAFSEGHGSSAAKAALLAVAYVLAERALYVLCNRWTRGPTARSCASVPPSLPGRGRGRVDAGPAEHSTLTPTLSLAGRGREGLWLLYRRPLLVAGWAVSGGAIGLALVRNLVLLGAGREQQVWAVAGLGIVVGLYALSARMFRRAIFAWLAAALAVAPWTILTHLGWFVWPEAPRLPAYALAWLILAYLLLALGLFLEWRNARPYGFALRVVAHVLVPFSLLWCVADVAIAYIAWGLGVAFYAASAFADHRHMPGQSKASRFIYPAAGLAPAWAVYLLAQFAPTAVHLNYGWLLLAFGPLGLAVGILLRRVHKADALPPYLAAYGSALVGTFLVAHDRPWLIAALLFDAGLCVFSAWLHREPLWGYPASAFPVGALWLALAHLHVDPNRHGWALIALGAAYLVVAYTLRQAQLGRYAAPLMAVAYVSVALGLPPSSRDLDGALVGYAFAATVYALSAVWLRQSLLLTPALALSAVPYAVVLYRLPIPTADYGLWLWPGIAVALVIAHVLDSSLGAPRGFPWDQIGRWKDLPQTIVERWLTWPGLPFYAAAFLGAVVSVGLSWRWGTTMHIAATLALTAAAYGVAAYRFRLRVWLLAAGLSAQLAALALIHHYVGLWRPADCALAFLPVTVITALLALVIERRFGEGSPLAGWLCPLVGWSRPLYALLVVDLLVGQAAAFYDGGPGSAVSLGHALLLALLASAWAQPALAYAAAGWTLVPLLQWMDWSGVSLTTRPVLLTLLAVGGIAGYGLTIARSPHPFPSPRWREEQLPPWLGVWEKPLSRVGLAFASLALLWAAWVGGWDVVSLTIRALFEQPVAPAQSPAVGMAVAVLGLAGLVYLAAALVERWEWLGYGAVASLLAAYGLWALLFLGQREAQFYAAPAGVYLLGVGYVEWRAGRRTLARWVDWTALTVLFGSAFLQSLLPDRWPYTLLMVGEGLAVLVWGSARRLRRFLYAGVAGVVLAVVGQMLSQTLRSVSGLGTALVLGAVGLAILLIALLVEWRLEAVKRLSKELRERLEGWE